MILFIILGVVVFITFIVLGVLFFMLSREAQKKEEEKKAVPLTDLNQLKKDLSMGLLEPQKPKAPRLEAEIIPPFEPKVSLPTQAVQVPIPVEDDVYKKRAKELEEELRTITLKAEGQSDEAKRLIETLTQENEALKSQRASLEQAQQKLVELQGESSNLKTENANLQTQLETTNAKVGLLEGQMAAIKIQMEEETSRANAAVTELNREKEALLSTPKPEVDQTLHQELEILKSEQIQLKQKIEVLEKSNQELQYELIKARAQSSGLERVSFNYKNQLEDFFKKVNTAQASNEQLSQVKNRLEGMVEEIKVQNEELVKRDQLAQFELEKNRSRLASLEREYEDFKARAQQKDQ